MARLERGMVATNGVLLLPETLIRIDHISEHITDPLRKRKAAPDIWKLGSGRVG